MARREELAVVLETSILLLVGMWATVEGSTLIAAFLLDIGGSERPLRRLGAQTCYNKG